MDTVEDRFQAYRLATYRAALGDPKPREDGKQSGLEILAQSDLTEDGTITVGDLPGPERDPNLEYD